MRKINLAKQQEYVLLSVAPGHQRGLPTRWCDDAGGKMNKLNITERTIKDKRILRNNKHSSIKLRSSTSTSGFKLNPTHSIYTKMLVQNILNKWVNRQGVGSYLVGSDRGIKIYISDYMVNTWKSANNCLVGIKHFAMYLTWSKINLSSLTDRIKYCGSLSNELSRNYHIILMQRWIMWTLLILMF